ncbi:hypothetical protein [Labilibaculum sp.]|uniref:hypothetical protein n=1 Tax=Labilibaculum sp. TaxID=2060723 RepID=UPI003561B47D
MLKKNRNNYNYKPCLKVLITIGILYIKDLFDTQILILSQYLRTSLPKDAFIFFLIFFLGKERLYDLYQVNLISGHVLVEIQ